MEAKLRGSVYRHHICGLLGSILFSNSKTFPSKPRQMLEIFRIKKDHEGPVGLKIFFMVLNVPKKLSNRLK